MSFLMISLLIIMGWLNLVALIWNGRLKASVVDLEVLEEKNTNEARHTFKMYAENFKKYEERFDELKTKVDGLGKLYKNSPRSK